MALRSMMRASLAVLWLSALAAGSLYAQSNPPSGQTRLPPAAGDGQTSTGAPNAVGSRNRESPAGASIPMSLFISGSVVMDDDGRLPIGVTIERVCDGRVTRESYVDPNGFFAFQVGESKGLLPDVSDDIELAPATGWPPRTRPGFLDGTRASRSRLVGCELRAALPGYRSTAVMLRDVRSMGNLDVGTIILSPLERTTGTMVSVFSLQAPKKARSEVAKAQKETLNHRFPEAEQHLRTALDLDPKYVGAWFELGKIHQLQGQFDEARADYLKAIAIDDKYVAPHVELSRMAALQRNWSEAADISGHALELDPLSFPEAYLIHSIASFNLSRLGEAEQSARMSVRLDAEHRFPKAYLVLANLFEIRNDWSEAADQLRDFLKYAPAGSDAEIARTRLLTIEKRLVRQDIR